MRKTALVLSLTVFTAVAASAQTEFDALMFSENNYEGTARTMAMGNAFTALGGDPGAVNINPAGSAVAKYSQITITPGISISTNTASGTILSGDSSPYSFENRIRNSNTRFSFPNYGVTLNFDTHRTSGIRNFNIGFVANVTNRFQDGLAASGTNAYTSYMGALAASSNGFHVSELENTDNYYNGYPWSSILGIQSGMINTFGSVDNEYIGATEKIYDDGTIELAGPLDQTFRRNTRGSKYDYVFNFGLNISDLVYLGANLGVTSLYYSSSEVFTEAAIDPADFEISYINDDGSTSTTNFSDMRHKYEYHASGIGVYGKFGILVTPGAGFRIGAAIQTPTSTNITEYWQESAGTYYTDSRYDLSAETPEGEYSYRLISPFRFNAGVAYTLGNIGLISVDYEICDYGGMKFKSIDGDVFADDEFEMQNQNIKDFMSTSHMLRAGIEIKPFPELAVRAGYNLTTSPQMEYNADNVLVKSPAMTHKGSFGLGFSSKGSFYADAACTYTKYANEYVYPYVNYITDDSGTVTFPSPEILNRKGMWQIVLTLGFRF